MEEKPSLPIMLYDHQCPLCKRFKDALERLPGTDRITKVSAHEDKIYEYYPQINKENCLKELHIIDAQGTVLTSAAAVTFLIEQFPGVSKFAWLIESGMGQKAIEFFHKMADHYREELLKRCPDCNKS